MNGKTLRNFKEIKKNILFKDVLFLSVIFTDTDIREKAADAVSIQNYITDFTTILVLSTDYVI